MTPEQLKASILQYAMEGKLVKQDPNDEPASELVKKIENEKNQLVEEGKIKKGRKTGAIAENEKPFDIPNSWSWIRLNAIANDIGDGLHGTPKYTSNGEYSFINGSNLKSGSISLVNAKHIDKAEYEKIKINLDKKSILISLNGTLGNLAKYNNEKVALGKSAGYVVLTNNLVFDYIYVFLESPVFKSFYTQNYTGTTIKNIPLKALRNCPIPLPPIEEQKRIVAKIEKLMPLVDEYAESYNRLQKIDNEFEDKLKQSVLQYAMEGKLVKQNPSDEPASELIKKIENEKAELVKEGKIKKSKKLPAITDDEKPFDIPDSWEWVKLGNIVDYVQRGKSPKYDKESTRYPIISQKCVQWDGIHLEFAKHLKEDFWEGLPSYRFVTKGDLLFNSTGTGTVGRVIKVTEPFNKVPVDSHVTVIRLNQNICNSYIRKLQ